MKRTLLTLLFGLILAVHPVVAQEQDVLPKPGLSPASRFYFLDRLGEALQEFFTFNPEAKARLQITFAAERIAEIKLMLESKGVQAKGLDVAQSRLQAHIVKVAEIIDDEKGKGKDVSALAEELDDDLDEQEGLLRLTFKERKDALKAREKELKALLNDAKSAGDQAKIDALTAELADIKAQKELLGREKEEMEKSLGEEEDRREDELKEEERALEDAEEAEEAEEAAKEAAEDEREAQKEAMEDASEEEKKAAEEAWEAQKKAAERAREAEKDEAEE